MKRIHSYSKSSTVHPMDGVGVDGKDKDKESKGYVKKLKKRATSGRVTTQDTLRDCSRHGIEVKTGIHFLGREHNNQLCDITTEDLRKAIRSIAIPESQAPPKCLSVLNRAKYSKILHVHFFNCDELDSFFAALSKEIKPELTPLTVRVHRDSSRIHLLPDRVLSISGIDLGEEEDEEEREKETEVDEKEEGIKQHANEVMDPKEKVHKRVGQNTGNIRSENVDVDEFTTNGIEEKLEEFVASHSLMVTWKYPLPIEECDSIHHNSISSISNLKKRKFAGDTLHGISSSTSIIYKDTFQLLEKNQAQIISKSLDKVSVRVKDRNDLIANDAVHHDFVETLGYEDEKQTMFGGDYKQKLGGPLSIVAIDCEMCDTEDGLELARMTLLDKFGVIIMDHYVKPNKPITNYRTKYSGIDENKMSSVNTSFEQVQIAFLQVVTKETILIGHSLENDLKAIKVVHRRCVDTSILYPHPKGFPYRQSLKFLSKEFLNKEIQSASFSRPQNGHDSIEDAECTLQLAILKGNMGPFFGGDLLEESMRIAYRDVLDEDMSRLAHNDDNGGADNTTEIPAGMQLSLLWHSVELFTMYGTVYGNIWSGAHGDMVVPGDFESTLHECKKMLTSPAISQKLSHSWCFMGIDFDQIISDNYDTNKVIKKLNDFVDGIDDRVACIFTGQVNLRKANDLATRKKVCKRAGAKCVATFNQSMEQELKAELNKVNKGYALLF